MNYFGHASIATLAGESAGFTLGAMLPDLAAMAGMRCPTFEDPVLQAGVAFHLQTDAVFHQTETFIRLNRSALSELTELGVRRGPARASAHIGIEMLIDSELSARSELLQGYFGALTHGYVQSSFAPLSFPLEKALQGLCKHLERRGMAVFSRTEQRFYERLGRALTGRPRLAPSEEEFERISRYLSRQDALSPHAAVNQSLASLLEELAPLFRRDESPE